MLAFLIQLRKITEGIMAAGYTSEPDRLAAAACKKRIDGWIDEETTNALDRLFEWRDPGPGGYW